VIPRLLPALILALAALPAQAEVYKWVDAKGQINYSNTPPPSVAGKAQVVEEQISVMGMDPAVRAWADQRFAARERQAELDWQQRQQRATYMQTSASSYGSSSGYGGDYYPSSYYGGAYYPASYRRHHHFRPTVIHHSSGPRISHHAGGSRSTSRR
jgi:hypothetical protein